MILVVADTSPINYLVLIGEIELLPKFFERVLLPEAVKSELSDEKSPEVVKSWIAGPPSWVQIRDIQSTLHYDLDEGEAAAISLAKELNAAIIIDEIQGRQIAAQIGLRVTGTIGVLELAAAEGLIDLSACIEKLRRTNCRISDDLARGALARATA